VKEAWQKDPGRPDGSVQSRGTTGDDEVGAGGQRALSDTAITRSESSSAEADEGPTMEEVVGRGNMFAALKRVQANEGAPGPDGMTVQELPGFLRSRWPAIREQLLDGTYRPQPVRRVAIPKPGGGERNLGIPNVIDRLIQQALLQALQPRWDPTFSPHSNGFRPGRSAHQAVRSAQQYVAGGHEWVVDIDIEKFFDRVNHDLLMGRVAKRIRDKRILRLIRNYLTAGAIMPDGLRVKSEEGTPQGGPLSPLLANLLLDDLDQELTRRGLRFVRYADDCNIYVGSARAATRVLGSISNWLKRRLRLQVNGNKSAAALATDRKFLGFRLIRTRSGEVLVGIATQALVRARDRLREMTGRNCGRKVEDIVTQVTKYLNGWWGYYGRADRTGQEATGLLSWLRRRLRQIRWIQWKTWRRRWSELDRLAPGHDRQWLSAGALVQCGPWRAACLPTVHAALSNRYWEALGLPLLGRPVGGR
jgi:RNA-directed DNA polymerase